MDLSPPTPGAPVMAGADLQRVEHTRLRWRIMYGLHREDARQRIRESVGRVREDAWGIVDVTQNLMLQLWTQVAVMYAAAPRRFGPQRVLDILAADHLDQRMPRFQRDTLALREGVLVQEWVASRRGVVYHPVPPHLVEAETEPGTDRLVRLDWYRRVDGLGWVRDRWDVRGEPSRTVTTANGAASDDVTERVLGRRYEGEAYPWRDGGVPFVPAVVYHAERAATLWDPYTYHEIVEATLNVAVLLSFYGHVVRNAAWQKHLLIDCEPAGLDVAGSNGSERTEVVMDPATALLVRAVEGGANPQAVTLGQPVDPEQILRSVSMYIRQSVALAGYSTPDVTKRDADIRSGYSLAVSRESVREQQTRYEDGFRVADVETMRITAMLVNAFDGGDLPTDAASYRIEYQGLPESPGEGAARVALVEARQRAGVIGPVSAYIELHPGTPPAEAVERLVQAATERELLARAVASSLAGEGAPVAEVPVERAVVERDALAAYSEGRLTRSAAQAFLVRVGVPEALVEQALSDSPTPRATPAQAPPLGGTTPSPEKDA